MASLDDTYDLLIVGGGINGTGIARDAAGRGLKVLLCERDDLAAHTSSASTKLVHGGLRYLEYYEFSLVRKALIEREVLLRAAPHIIWPLRFVMPHSRGLRPRWMIRLGLFLYDHLGGRKLLPPSNGVNLRRHAAGEQLQPKLTRGYVYSDCWVQDSRLVILNAVDAAENGATVLTRTACTGATRHDGHWDVELADQRSGGTQQVRARAVVNAAGPWVSRFLDQTGQSRADKQVRLIKGSHIVVHRLYDHDYAYVFQNPDKRVIFVIPYEGRYTLIGTTDELFEGDPSVVEISDREIDYLCDTVNTFFERPVTREDIAWTYSGVRPLYDDAAENASAITRDYVLDLDAREGRAPMLSIFGGKITTYRKLAEEAMDLLARPLQLRETRRWTADTPLPGGDIPDADFDGYLDRVRQRYPFLPAELAWRYARNYGTRTEQIVGDARSLAELGDDLGDSIYAAELRYLRDHEWAESAEAVLWRRSRLGLHVSAATRERIEAWFAAVPETGTS
ncbi:glycerol-3-phosphate dehydrogenase [Aquisalimonas lutea]|uniref:glycerol-3-phosphate dehydrogenase n=1 Tax=Aquisalimonas lutea TaxID=1327750 RepID=UPI0025B3B576|nr:glycerol-3-phosphate dehydrogenase [Aquisalimonas lutea]MDN3516256.1 glycerol-3-phosphate dehydrogenase [Aquisalimonas lutea]